MHRRLLTVLTVLAVSLYSVPASAVGEAGAISLTIPPGARANGMGGAFTAVSDDATAQWWNPGGLAFSVTKNLGLMHTQLVPDLDNDVYYEFLGYNAPVKGVGTWSVSVVYLTYGTSEGRDIDNAPTGTFKSWEGAVYGTFAMPLTDNVGVGLTVKAFHADLAPADLTLEKIDGSGSTVALDVGALWKIDSWNLALGGALVNIGPDISYIDQNQSDPLPLTLRVGFAYNVLHDEVSNLLLTFDLEQSMVWLISTAVSTRRSEIYHVGAEYTYINLLAGRIGYIYDEDGDFKDPTYGLGFIFSEKVMFDYANVPQATTLDRVHRWSIGVRF